MKQFPSTEGFERSEISNDLILGGSIAINKPLLWFREIGMSGKTHPTWDIYLVNVYSIFRNNFKPNSNMTVKQINTLVDLETDLLTTYIEAYHANTPGAKKPVIVFYTPTYRIPDKWKKSHEGQANELSSLYKKALTVYPVKLTDVTQSPDSIRFLLPVGNATYPHRELASAIKGGLFTKGLGTVNPKVLLFTHCLIDYHIAKSVQLTLMEFHTGLLKTPKDFGSRLVKGDDLIPFNVYTHRLFGDFMLKPLVERAAKKKAIELAHERKWHLMTEEEICRDIVIRLDISEMDLREIKF